MKRIYLILAIIGAILPYIFFLQFFINSGFDLPGFISSLFVIPVAAGFTVDLLITSFVFWIWMIYQCRNKSGLNPVVFYRIESIHWSFLRISGLSVRIQ
jgi:hypothetical protein